MLPATLVEGCVDKSADYCNELIEKSVCHPIKNECFCGTGFVAIREDDKISCKTLLTNLKCRIDSDCIHVQNSSCHPGAGRCACPYNTIYVQDLHACRLRVRHNSTPFCVACKQKKGECYMYDQTDQVSLFSNQSAKLIGCACSSGRKSVSITEMKTMCTSFTVDIGEYCDDENYFCQSKKATCSSENSFSIQNRFCSCQSNQIAVYQNVLHYHECADIVKYSKLCSICEKVGGVCYDENKNGIPDGCVCPQHLSHSQLDYSLKASSQICSIKHVHVDCSNNYLSICYYPHFHFPYENLQQMLSANQSIAGINVHRSNIEMWKLCKLVPRKNKEFCIKILKTSNLADCAIYKFNLKSKKVMYKANLQIIFDIMSSSSIKDLQFPITCISDDLSAVDQKKTISTPAKPNLSSVKTKLNFANENGQIIQSATENELIRLQIAIQVPSNHRYYSRPEECYLSNSSNSNDPGIYSAAIKIITNGCPEANNGFHSRFQNVMEFKNLLLSENFIPFQIFHDDSILIKCTIKVCMELIHCHPVSCYENKLKMRSKVLRISTYQWTFVERWTKLILKKKITNKNNNHIQKKACHHLICLSISQTLLIALLLGGLVIALITLLVIFGNSKAQHDKTNKKDLKNVQRNSFPFFTDRQSCTSCSLTPQMKSYVAFNTLNLTKPSPIRCYALIESNHRNVRENASGNYEPTPNMNVEPGNEIYEC